MVLDEVKDLNLKKLVVLAEDDFETREAVKNSDCEILFQTGKGYGNAIREGIKHATTKYIAIFYADGSTDPIDLKPMINKLLMIKIKLFLEVDMKKMRVAMMTTG